MKDPRPPGSGKRIAKGKGVRCEAESEGRWRQNSDPTNRNHVRSEARVRLRHKLKPNSCTESLTVNMAGIRGKECVSTRGGLTGGGKKTVVTTNCEKSAEAIVPQKKVGEGPNNRKSEEG